MAHSTPVLQVCIVAPVHAAPPLAGAGLVHVRVCVPPLPSAVHATLHVDQSLKPPSTGQSTPTLQACEVAPEQAAPPLVGAGLVQVRVCVPPLPSALQFTLHADQLLKPPSIPHSTPVLHA